MDFLIVLVDMTVRIITILVIAKVILSYFMSPYHPIRETMDRLVEPLLAPVRRVVPAVGMIDFSPIVLIIGLQLLRVLLINTLRSF
jgi:YggT family protein